MAGKSFSEDLNFPDGNDHSIKGERAILAAKLLFSPNTEDGYTDIEILEAAYPHKYQQYLLEEDEAKKKDLLRIMRDPLYLLQDQLYSFGYCVFVNTTGKVERYKILTRTEAFEQQERRNGSIVRNMNTKENPEAIEFEDEDIPIVGERQIFVSKLLKRFPKGISMDDIDAYINAKYGDTVDCEDRRNAILRNIADDLFRYGLCIAIIHHGALVKVMSSVKAAALIRQSNNVTVVEPSVKLSERLLVQFPDGSYGVKSEKTKIWAEYLLTAQQDNGGNILKIMAVMMPDIYQQYLAEKDDAEKEVLLEKVNAILHLVNTDLKRIGYCIFCQGIDKMREYMLVSLPEGKQRQSNGEGLILGEKANDFRKPYTIQIGEELVYIGDTLAYHAYNALKDISLGVSKDSLCKILGQYSSSYEISKVLRKLSHIIRPYGLSIINADNTYYLVHTNLAKQFVAKGNTKKDGVSPPTRRRRSFKRELDAEDW